MKDKESGNLLAKLYYVVYKKEITVSYVESVEKGSEYGTMVMLFLAKKHSYEKVH